MNRLGWWGGLVCLLVFVGPISLLAAEYKSAAEAFEKGNTFLDKGDLNTAISVFTKAITLNPKDAQAYRNRGVAYEIKGDYDKAIADFTEAIRLDPKDAKAFGGRGSVHVIMGDNEKAIAD